MYRGANHRRSEVPHLENNRIKVVAKNREAYHAYFVIEEFEAGISLAGTEVKSIRQGTLSLKDAWCGVKDGELWIRQMHISPYEKGNIFNKDPMRPRKLLMHSEQILYLFGKVKQDGYAIIPLQVYFRGPRVKLEIALCKGKKLYDKRDDPAQARRQAADGPRDERKESLTWRIPLSPLKWKTAASSPPSCTRRSRPVTVHNFIYLANSRLL